MSKKRAHESAAAATARSKTAAPAHEDTHRGGSKAGAADTTGRTTVQRRKGPGAGAAASLAKPRAAADDATRKATKPREQKGLGATVPLPSRKSILSAELFSDDDDIVNTFTEAAPAAAAAADAADSVDGEADDDADDAAAAKSVDGYMLGSVKMHTVPEYDLASLFPDAVSAPPGSCVSTVRLRDSRVCGACVLFKLLCLTLRTRGAGAGGDPEGRVEDRLRRAPELAGRGAGADAQEAADGSEGDPRVRRRRRCCGCRCRCCCCCRGRDERRR